VAHPSKPKKGNPLIKKGARVGARREQKPSIIPHSLLDDKPSATKKMKQHGQSEDASSAAASATATTTVFFDKIIHGPSNHSALDSFSFSAPTGAD
jgi:hypothetical protein